MPARENPIACTPGQSFNLDLMVDLPEVQLNGIAYSKILVAVDRFSKRVYLMEIPKHATAPQLAQTFVDKVLLEAGNGICHVSTLGAWLGRFPHRKFAPPLTRLCLSQRLTLLYVC
jgi:hypothetical protein